MALLPILLFPDPRLQTVAAAVDVVDDGIRRLIDDMASTMYAADGIGLAATQVNVHRRVIVVDVSHRANQLHALINPVIVQAGGSAELEEGCLSMPGVYDKVRRAAWIKVRALDRVGQPFELRADGMLAMCLQHEMDHLQGMVFIEHLSHTNQERIRSRITARPQR